LRHQFQRRLSIYKSSIILKGILQKADTLNQNGRIYPQNVLEREVRNYQKFILENRALGELDHPPESVISLKNVSHIVRSLEMKGNEVYGTVEVLNTPMGQTLRSLIESKVQIGISSRGVGTTKKDGDYDVVQNDYQLICFDIVSEPSTPGAFLFTENKVVSRKEIDQFFGRSVRIDRILNEILTLKR
jgi:hypothetical protein